jgi:predicted ester cyclase
MTQILASTDRAALVALARRFEDAVNAHDLDAIAELIDGDYVEHQAPPGLPERGQAAVTEVFREQFRAFPDYRLRLDDVMVDGDRICMRATQLGTQEGPLFGMAPHGRRMEAQTIDIVRVRDKRFVEHWGASDEAAMAMQLGWYDPLIE